MKTCFKNFFILDKFICVYNKICPYLTAFLLSSFPGMLPNTSFSLLHVILFSYNPLSLDTVAYVCTLMPVQQHMGGGLRTTWGSRFSLSTMNPENKSQVAQLT